MTTAELDLIALPSRSGRWPAPASCSRWEYLPPVVLLVLGSVLLLRGHPLWFDELYTAEVVRHSVPDIVRAIVDGRGTTSYLEDVPPSYNAPYYLVVKAWVALPFIGGDQSLRLLSLLAAAGGVALLTRAVSRLTGPLTGVVAGLAVAINPLLLKQAVEARSYGLVVLATSVALLGLVRWLDDDRLGLLLFGLGGAGMGLAHWYALLVLVGFALTGLVLRGRGALPMLAVSGAAVLPTAGLVLLNLLTGNGDRNVAHLVDTDGELPRLAALAWAGERMSLFWLTLVLAAVALVRVPRLRVLGTLWVGVPLLALVLAEAFLRPVFTPRYLLPALIGLGVLAAVGAVAWPRRVAAVLSVLLLAVSTVAVRDVLQRDPRERGDEVVALLSLRQQPGEPIVAADRRSALALDHFSRLDAQRLAADLTFPPVDPPLGADRVWLVRREVDGEVSIGDDDAVLTGDGLRVVEEIRFGASATDFLVQRWERAAPSLPRRISVQERQRSECRSRAQAVHVELPTGRAARGVATLVTGSPDTPSATTRLGPPSVRIAWRASALMARKAPASDGSPVSRLITCRCRFPVRRRRRDSYAPARPAKTASTSPAVSWASSAGTASGGSCRSASRQTHMSASLSAARPIASARCCPTLVASVVTAMRWSFAARSAATAWLPSGEASTTRRSRHCQSASAAASRVVSGRSVSSLP